MLVWEDNHQIGAREETGELFRQSFQSRLVGYGTLSGSHHHKEMVLAHVGGKLRHLVPMLHQGVFGSYFLMSVGDVLIDECQDLLPAVELDAAIQIA